MNSTPASKPSSAFEFFLDGVAETANQAFEAAVRIADLFANDRERIATGSDRAGSALRIHDLLQRHPFATANDLVTRTGLTAINAALRSRAPGRRR